SLPDRGAADKVGGGGAGAGAPAGTAGAGAAVKPELASKEAPFENSLGMKFVPVAIGNGPSAGKTVLFSIWETRVQDYAAYAAANTGVNMVWKDYEYKGHGQALDHPVVNVSWEDAKGFCAWLTKEERSAGQIGPNDEYRPPSDVEWSWAVGIGDREDASVTPREKSGDIDRVYPWGTAWPPPSGVGNFSGKESASTFGKIEGYKDQFPFTAPVGSYGANEAGLYDLGGNVMEWCEDQYGTGGRFRGSSWDHGDEQYLRSSYRSIGIPIPRNESTGFRCVLVVGVAR
ncbi:MAG: formylglycine-generating enzyme family protein, partial [Verrucomicrobiae bacterium]|nr:formylglycine-generating enzyme family protein [Verrucomicrobiae bacterium]